MPDSPSSQRPIPLFRQRALHRGGVITAAVSALLLLTSSAVARPSSEPPDPAAQVSEVTVGVEPSPVEAEVEGKKGRAEAPPPLSAAEVAEGVVVELGGVRQRILEASREERPWRLVIYLDTLLSGPYTVARATRALEALTPQLTELGSVEIVVAGERVRRLLPPSRDPDQVSAVLARANLMEDGADALVALRREGLLELEMTASPEQAAVVAGDRVAREATLVEDRLDTLLGYLAEDGDPGGEGDGRGGPRAVLLVGDGFDLDPAAIWRRQPGLESFTSAAASVLQASHEGTARALAALGWTVVPLALRQDFESEDFRLEDHAGGRETVTGKPGLFGRWTFGGSPEQRAEDELAREAGPPPVPLDPDAPLDRLAAATGGRRLGSAADLPELLADLGSRYRLRFAPPAARRGGRDATDAGDSGLLSLAVTPRRSELAVRAPRWVGEGTPRAVSALRARRLLAGELDPGQVTVRAALGLESDTRGQLEIRVEPPPVPGDPGAAIPPGPRRLTVATQGADGGPATVFHRVVEGRLAGEEVAATEGAPPDTVERALDVARWVYREDVELPPGTARVAVVVEEPGAAGRLTGGRWGGSVAGIFDTRTAAGPSSAGVYDLASGFLPGPRPVNLLRPQGEMLTGDVVFETVVTAGVERVDFYLDGRRRQRVPAPPFTARLDLGRLPEISRVGAVAYDAGGAELGRDELVVNGGTGRLRVRITEPAEVRAVGAVDVAADVDVPEAASLDRLEVFWRDRLAATLFQPPFRHRLMVPADDPEGTLRVVAHLVDGTRAEDVVYLNGPVAGDRIDVRLTELYVVVTGRDGRPVRGLTAADFTVRENGERQRVETFDAAGDLPITVGLAIDSSASMFVKLPEVQEAAAEFLGELDGGRDRAFLVDFDDGVRLAAATTGELGEVRRAGFGLVADGRTSLWRAVVYSLVQLQSAPGRKALVVYSDGADEDDDFPFRDALAFARKVGVPIYVIVSNDEAVRTGGIPIGFPSLGRRLQKLTAAVGGRVWLVRRGDDLADIYRQIEEELSAQYLLGYYPDDGGLVDGWRDWRRIEVEVEGRGLEARTLAGYQR